MENLKNLEKLRSAGRLEHCAIACHYLKFYYNVAVTASYNLPENYTLPLKDYIYRSCETLIGQHPVLSAIPVDEDTKEPYYVRLPQVDLTRTVTFKERSSPLNAEDDQDLEALLQLEHNTLFAPASPFWRLCILTDAANERQFTVVFVFHHAIGDGVSGMAFHRTFLSALRTAASLSPGQAKQIIPSPQIPLLPTQEEVHSPPLSYLFLATVLFRKYWPASTHGLWSGSIVTAPSESRVKNVVIPAPLTTSFKNVCRQNSTTITATLQTIVARAILTHVPESFTYVNASGAISSRRWLPDPITDDSLGNWVEDLKETYTRQKVTGESFPWDEARRSRETIQQALSREGKDGGAALLKYVDDFQEFFLSKVGKQRGASYEVSNVGVLGSKGPQDDSKPQIGRVIFSQSASTAGNALQVSTATGADGCMVLAFSWQKSVVEEELALAVIESIRTQLQSLCAE